MNPSEYIEAMDQVDLVSLINTWAGKSADIHHTHLYPLAQNAVISEVPTMETIHGDTVFVVVMQTILKATQAASKICTKDGLAEMANHIQIVDIDASMAGVRFTESTHEFYDRLRELAKEASMHWHLLSMQTGISTGDFEAFKEVACQYLLDREENPEHYGFVKLGHDWYYENDYESEADLWWLNEDEYLKEYKGEDDASEDALYFFKESRDTLNMIYRHSVAMINYYPWLEIMAERELDVHNRHDGDPYWNEYDPNWLKKPKTGKHSLRSRSFRNKYLGEQVEMAPDDHDGKGISIETVRNQVEAAIRMDNQFQQYKEPVEALIKTRQSTFMSDEEIDHIVKWFDDRKKWYWSYKRVWNWLYQSEFYVPDGTTWLDWTKMIELQKEVDLQDWRYEEIKADNILLNRKEAINAKKAVKGGSAYDRYRNIMKELGPELKEEGWIATIQSRNDAVHHTMNWETVRKFGNLNPDAEPNAKIVIDSMTGEWLDRVYEKVERQEKDRLERMGELDMLLDQYSGLTKFKNWKESVADLNGTCTRKDIGFQRVKENSGDAAQRNAGKRFVESIAKPFPLDPVKHFIELDLLGALQKELKVRIDKSTNHLMRADKEKILRNFRRFRNYSDFDQIKEFGRLLDQLGYGFSDIETFVGEAIKDVGKKDPTNRTLYDARHVALAFCLDNIQQNKLPRNNDQLEMRNFEGMVEANIDAVKRGMDDVPYDIDPQYWVEDYDDAVERAERAAEEMDPK